MKEWRYLCVLHGMLVFGKASSVFFPLNPLSAVKISSASPYSLSKNNLGFDQLLQKQVCIEEVLLWHR